MRAFSVLKFSLFTLAVVAFVVPFTTFVHMRKAEAVTGKISSLGKPQVTQLPAVSVKSADFGGPPYGGINPGSPPASGNCPGCKGPGGGGGGWGGTATTNGVAAWRAEGWEAFERTKLHSGWGSNPSPLGTYANQQYRGALLGDIQSLAYTLNGRPCSFPKRNVIVKGEGDTPSVLSDGFSYGPRLAGWYFNDLYNSDSGVAIASTGFLWWQQIDWPFGGDLVVGYRWGQRFVNDYQCINSPQPALYWKDCPIDIERVQVSGPWGLKLVGDKNAGSKTVRKGDTIDELEFSETPAPGNKSAWWYVRGSAPASVKAIRDAGLTDAAALNAVNALPSGVRFTAMYKLIRAGHITPGGVAHWGRAVNGWTFERVWNDIISQCDGKWIKTGVSRSPNKDNVGNYDTEMELERVRCHMVVYPAYTGEATARYLSTDSGYRNETFSWPELKEPPQGVEARYYGCGKPYLNKTGGTALTIFGECITADKDSEFYSQGKNFKVYSKDEYGGEKLEQEPLSGEGDFIQIDLGNLPPGFNKTTNELRREYDFHSAWWKDPNCASDTKRAVEEISAFCEYRNPTPVQITNRSGEVGKGSALILADGSSVNVNWAGNAPTIKDSTGRALTNPAEVDNFISERKTKITNNVNRGQNSPYPYISFDDNISSPVRLNNWSPGWGGQVNGWDVDNVSMNFYKGTKYVDGKYIPFEVLIERTFKRKVTTKTTIYNFDGTGWTASSTEEIKWVASKCPAIKAEIIATQTRVGSS